MTTRTSIDEIVKVYFSSEELLYYLNKLFNTTLENEIKPGDLNMWCERRLLNFSKGKSNKRKFTRQDVAVITTFVELTRIKGLRPAEACIIMDFENLFKNDIRTFTSRLVSEGLVEQDSALLKEMEDYINKFDINEYATRLKRKSS